MLKTIPEYDEETEEEGPEAPVSWEEFQSLKGKAKELQEVVNKRAAVGVAEVRFIPCFTLQNVSLLGPCLDTL